MKLRRLWQDEEIIDLGNTFSTLRKMRDAASCKKAPVAIRFRGWINELMGEDFNQKKPDEIVHEAQDLADAMSDFLALCLVRRKKISEISLGTHQREKWQDLLSDAEKEYKNYQAITFARTTARESVGNSLIGRMRQLDIDPEHMISWDLCINNNLGLENYKELQKGEVLVVSPLTGDYIMASVYSNYLKYKRRISLETKAIAISKNLERVVMKKEEVNPEKIAIYIDTTETGQTSRAIYDFLKKEYPEADILKTPDEIEEFKPK